MTSGGPGDAEALADRIAAVVSESAQRLDTTATITASNKVSYDNDYINEAPIEGPIMRNGTGLISTPQCVLSRTWNGFHNRNEDGGCTAPKRDQRKRVL